MLDFKFEGAVVGNDVERVGGAYSVLEAVRLEDIGEVEPNDLDVRHVSRELHGTFFLLAQRRIRKFNLLGDHFLAFEVRHFESVHAILKYLYLILGQIFCGSR